MSLYFRLIVTVISLLTISQWLIVTVISLLTISQWLIVTVISLLTISKWLIVTVISLLTISQFGSSRHRRLLAAFTTDAFLLQLRAEVDKDRLLFVTQHSAVQQQVSRLAAQVTQLSVQVIALQGQISAGGGGGGGGSGGGGSSHSGHQKGQGQTNAGQGQISAGGQGSVPQGSSCPSGCQVSSDVDRVRSSVHSVRVMVTQAVSSLQDHLADDGLFRHEALLQTLTRRVDHINVITSSQTAHPYSASPYQTATPKLVVSSTGAFQVTLTSPGAAVNLPQVVDSLKQHVKDLGEEQLRSVTAQNSRMSLVEQYVTQLQKDSSALQGSVRIMQNDVGSTSQRLQRAETESLEASRTLTQGLMEVNVSLTVMGDALHVLQASDAARAAAMQQLTQQQAGLSARLAGSSHRVTSLVSDFSHMDRRLTVMSGMIQSGAQRVKDLNHTLTVLLTSSPGQPQPGTVLQSSPVPSGVFTVSPGAGQTSSVLNNGSTNSKGATQPSPVVNTRSQMSTGAVLPSSVVNSVSTTSGGATQSPPAVNTGSTTSTGAAQFSAVLNMGYVKSTKAAL
ncbi:hypothetical protein ACOMHN_002944 [Nucella lapillus]